MLDPEKDQALCDAATPGPWATVVANVFRIVAPGAAHKNQPEGKCPPYPWRIIADTNPDSAVEPECAADDANFIKKARTLLPEYIAEVRRLQQACADRFDTIEALEDWQRRAVQLLTVLANHDVITIDDVEEEVKQLIEEAKC